MQKIFYNANCLTLNDSFEIAEAFFVNDENIVFAGTNEEVLKMKTQETELVDLQGKTIIPTFFCTETRLYEEIEQRLKTANLVDFIEKSDINDENYEKFDNFDVYLNEFLKLQDELIELGITTIQELGITQTQFAFWKKLADSGKIKIDIIGYVDLLTAKDVMDNNCRSYRKYKNHFRLGGYSFAIDGKLTRKKAWLKKPYKYERGYTGYSSVLSERLEFLIKTSLEEKHQLIVEANGDRAIEQYIEVIRQVFDKNKDEDKFKPILLNCNLASKKHLKQLNELGVAVNFELSSMKYEHKKLKNIIGRIRLSHFVQTKFAEKFHTEMLYHFSFENKSPFEIIEFLVSRTSTNHKVIGRGHKATAKQALLWLIKNSAKYAFEDSQKGSLESGKLCNFLVLSQNILTCKTSDISKIVVEKVYQNANLIYEKK